MVDKDERRYIDKMVSFAASRATGSEVNRRFLNFFKVMKDEIAVNVDDPEEENEEQAFG